MGACTPPTRSPRSPRWPSAPRRWPRWSAIIGNKVVPALDAAHIRSVKKGGEHRLDNGVLLRTDVHRLFDAGYLGIDQQHRLIVSKQLRAEFENGEEFYRLHGQELTVLPERRGDRPGREFIEWHMEGVFLAS